jgi:hypothetical protein
MLRFPGPCYPASPVGFGLEAEGVAVGNDAAGRGQREMRGADQHVGIRVALEEGPPRGARLRRIPVRPDRPLRVQAPASASRVSSIIFRHDASDAGVPVVAADVLPEAAATGADPGEALKRLDPHDELGMLVAELTLDP